MKRSIVLVLIAFIVVACNRSNVLPLDDTAVNLQLTLHGSRFKKMQIRFYNEKNSHFIEGRRVDSIRWVFPIPDSVYESYQTMRVFTFDRRSFDDEALLYFAMCYQGDTVFAANLNFNKNNPQIEARFIKKREYSKEGSCLVSGDDRNLVENFFLIENPDSETALSLSLFRMGFCGFYDSETKPYALSVYEYADTARQYPDSRALLQELSNQIDRFKAKADLRLVYQAFSDSLRATCLGRQVGNYLDTAFQYKPLTLLNVGTELTEPVILDSTRYHLLIFTNSIYPATKLGIFLDELKARFHPKLDVVYVYSGLNENLKLWKRDFIQMYHIADRCYQLPGSFSRKLTNRHGADSWLVTPDGEIVYLGLPRDGDRKKLINLLENN